MPYSLDNFKQTINDEVKSKNTSLANEDWINKLYFACNDNVLVGFSNNYIVNGNGSSDKCPGKSFTMLAVVKKEIWDKFFVDPEIEIQE